MKIDNRLRCVKKSVIAIIKTNDGRFYVGTNWCRHPQVVCPRKDMKTGEGYDLCKKVCIQERHAEVDAVHNAGNDSIFGATCYIIGHTYACDDCILALREKGITNVVVIQEKQKL